MIPQPGTTHRGERPSHDRRSRAQRGITSMEKHSATGDSQFHNHSVPELADILGQLDAEVKSLEERMKAAKAELNTRGVDGAEGERFNVTKSETVRWSLDTAAAKEALGEAWVTAHSKVSPVTTFRITVRRAALALAACDLRCRKLNTPPSHAKPTASHASIVGLFP